MAEEVADDDLWSPRPTPGVAPMVTTKETMVPISTTAKMMRK